jgi:hypothetical protein
VLGDRPYADAATRIARQVSDHPEQWPTLVAAVSVTDLGLEGPGADQLASETARHVRASATSRSLGTYREVVITLQIEPGYHINANPASFDFLIPTSVTFADVHPMEVHYPTPTPFKPSFAPDTLNVYEGTVQLVAKLEDGTLVGLQALSATVNAQACTESVCLPPARIALTVDLDKTERP